MCFEKAGESILFLLAQKFGGLEFYKDQGGSCYIKGGDPRQRLMAAAYLRRLTLASGIQSDIFRENCPFDGQRQLRVSFGDNNQ